MKLTRKILKRYYRRPTLADGCVARFVFAPKSASLLLSTLELEMVLHSRTFRARRRDAGWDGWMEDCEEVAVLRARLSPDQIAACVRAAIENDDDIPF